MPSAARRARRDPGRLLHALTVAGIAALVLAALVRAAAYLLHALPEIPAPDQPFLLEGVSVHFAWRVEHGLPLYPDGLGPSYVVNCMGPCYFWTIGIVGRLLDADITTLYVIGRVVTFVCGLGSTVIAALYLRPRYGPWAAWAALPCGLGAAPMIGYGVVVRPDMMANLLGVAGLFLTCREDRRWLPAAVVLLALGCLTKQTAAVWLLAAVVTLVMRPGTRRCALLLGGATAAGVLAAVLLLAATSEPHILSSLLRQAQVPLDPEQSLGILMLLGRHSPELIFFSVVGCGLWMSRRHEDRTLLILTVVWLGAAALTSAKKGSDLNYYLPLCVVEAIAAGTFCVAAFRSESRRIGWAITAWVGALLMMPSTILALETASATLHRRAALDTPSGRAERQRFEHYVQLARDPNVPMLTDSDRLAVYQGPRAAWLDAYLFRLEVESGQIDPRELVQRLRSRWYEYVIQSADAAGNYPERFFYRLPPQVSAALTAHYRLESCQSGLFVYVPR